MTSETVETAPAAAAADMAPKGGGAEAAKPANLTQAVSWRPPAIAVPHAAINRNPSLPTFASLMVLILTFFIVLTTISIHDKSRSEIVVTSLQDTFSGSANAGGLTADKESTEREYIAGLSDRIHSLVPLMGGKPAPASDHQVLWLPTSLAFVSDGAAPAPVFPAILHEVVASLGDVPQRFTPHLELRLCAEKPSDLLRQRALAIGAALSAEGAPMQQFAIGVARCDPSRIGIAVALAPMLEGPVP